MKLEIKEILVKKGCVTAICYTVDNDISVDQLLKTSDGKYIFKVISFETDSIIYDKPRFKIVLNQYGNKRYYITSIKEAMSCIGRTITEVKDLEEVKRINKEACYC